MVNSRMLLQAGFFLFCVMSQLVLSCADGKQTETFSTDELINLTYGGNESLCVLNVLSANYTSSYTNSGTPSCYVNASYATDVIDECQDQSQCRFYVRQARLESSCDEQKVSSELKLDYKWNCPVICPELNLDNGTVAYSDDKRLVGTHANHTCDVSYELVGPTSRRCRDDGTWSGMQPDCSLPTEWVCPNSSDFFNVQNYGEVCYEAVERSQNWTSANLYCSQRNGTVASSDSKDVLTFFDWWLTDLKAVGYFWLNNSGTNMTGGDNNTTCSELGLQNSNSSNSGSEQKWKTDSAPCHFQNHFICQYEADLSAVPVVSSTPPDNITYSSQKDNNIDNATLIGLAVGCSVGFVVLLVVIILVVCLIRRRISSSRLKRQGDEEESQKSPEEKELYQYSNPVSLSDEAEDNSEPTKVHKEDHELYANIAAPHEGGSRQSLDQDRTPTHPGYDVVRGDEDIEAQRKGRGGQPRGEVYDEIDTPCPGPTTAKTCGQTPRKAMPRKKKEKKEEKEKEGKDKLEGGQLEESQVTSDGEKDEPEAESASRKKDPVPCNGRLSSDGTSEVQTGKKKPRAKPRQRQPESDHQEPAKNTMYENIAFHSLTESLKRKVLPRRFSQKQEAGSDGSEAARESAVGPTTTQSPPPAATEPAPAAAPPQRRSKVRLSTAGEPVSSVRDSAMSDSRISTGSNCSASLTLTENDLYDS